MAYQAFNMGKRLGLVGEGASNTEVFIPASHLLSPDIGNPESDIQGTLGSTGYEPIIGSRGRPTVTQEDCPPGTVLNFVDNEPHCTYQYYDGGRKRPGGFTGGPFLGGSDPGPFTGDQGSSGSKGGATTTSGIPYIGRNEDYYHPDDETTRSLMIEQLKEELNFVDCASAGKLLGKQSLPPSNPIGCCCDDEARTKVATIMYHLLRRKIFDRVPWMRECLLNTARLVPICCDGHSRTSYNEDGEEAGKKYEEQVLDAILGNGVVSLWKDKLKTDSWLGEWYLAKALLKSCNGYQADIEDMRHKSIIYDLRILFGMRIEQKDICRWIKRETASGELDCENGEVMWIYFRYFVINLCTGEVHPLKSDGRSEEALTFDDIVSGPPIQKYILPSLDQCYELEHPDEKFGDDGFPKEHHD